MVDEARSVNRRPIINSRGTLKNIRVEQMKDPKERDREERIITFFAAPMSQDTGTHHRAYCMALESESGKQLFERDPNNPALVRLQIGRSNITENGTVVGEKVYNGQIERQVLPEVDPEEVKQAMGGDETPFCVDLGGVLTERTLGGKYGCRPCNRLWCGQGGGMNCFRVLNKRVTKKEREEDAKKDRERLNVRDTHPRKALWGRIDEAEEEPVKHLRVKNIKIAKQANQENGVEEAVNTIVYQLHEANTVKLGKQRELRAPPRSATREVKVAMMRRLGKDPRAGTWMKNLRMKVSLQEEETGDEERSNVSYTVQMQLEAKDDSVKLAASEEMLTAKSLVRLMRKGHPAWKDAVMEVTKMEKEECPDTERLKKAFLDTMNLTIESKKRWETQDASKIRMECNSCSEMVEARDMRDHLLISHEVEPQKVTYRVGETVEENMERLEEEGIVEEEIKGDLLEALRHYRRHNEKRRKRVKRRVVRKRKPQGRTHQSKKRRVLLKVEMGETLWKLDVRPTNQERMEMERRM